MQAGGGLHGPWPSDGGVGEWSLIRLCYVMVGWAGGRAMQAAGLHMAHDHMMVGWVKEAPIQESAHGAWPFDCGVDEASIRPCDAGGGSAHGAWPSESAVGVWNLHSPVLRLQGVCTWHMAI